MESGLSSTIDDHYAEVGCPYGYVLTGCSCYSAHKSCDGAKIATRDGAAVCRAYNGAGGEGIKATVACARVK